VLIAIVLVLWRWGNTRCHGSMPVGWFTFVAILFTSGLDVGLIMFPLTEFPLYADTAANPEYAFSNPLAISFGFWGFYIWSFYFITCFYFCVLEPKLGFFQKVWVKWLNNIVIIATCAFTAYLLLSNLPWYLPDIAENKQADFIFLAMVAGTILFGVLSSTHIRYVKILSLGSSALFLSLILVMGVNLILQPGVTPSGLTEQSLALLDYFAQLPQFVLPLNDYHEFYLFWWFSWCIMIGQFTARFVGGLRTWQVLAAMLVFPSIPIALWFSVLYGYFDAGLATLGWINLAMVVVGIIFVINSLDSLIRLYTDNLGLTTAKVGTNVYIAVNFAGLLALTLLFKLDFLQIQWVGAFVIGLLMMTLIYAMWQRQKLMSTRS